MGLPSPSGCRFRRRYRMYKVIVVEDETMVRRGIILTIDWAALDCVIAGEAANGEEGAELASS